MDVPAQWSPQAWQLQAGQTAYLPLAAGDWLVVGHGPVQLCLGAGAHLGPAGAHALQVMPTLQRLDSGEAWQAPAPGWVCLSSPGGAEWVHWARPAHLAGWPGLRDRLRRLFGGRGPAFMS